jgi:hypothetical protein
VVDPSTITCFQPFPTPRLISNPAHPVTAPNIALTPSASSHCHSVGVAPPAVISRLIAPIVMPNTMSP